MRPEPKPSYDQLREENANLKRILAKYLDDINNATLAADGAIADCRQPSPKIIPMRKRA